MKMIFVNSKLDEYGLTAPQFRVYAHLARRADNSTGKAWASVKKIAQVCRLHPRTVRAALKQLLWHRLIISEPRPGNTTVYTLSPPSQWRSSVGSIGAAARTSPAVSDCPARSDKWVQSHHSQSDTQEGNPMKCNPGKDIQTPPLSPKGDCVKDTGLTSSLEETIYNAYPRKVGKPVALRAIRRAVDKYSFDYVLQRTRLFAETCNSPAEFIPYPATWFRQERFNDDPSTWHRVNSTGGKASPVTIRSNQFGCGISKL